MIVALVMTASRQSSGTSGPVEHCGARRRLPTAQMGGSFWPTALRKIPSAQIVHWRVRQTVLTAAVPLCAPPATC